MPSATTTGEPVSVQLNSKPEENGRGGKLLLTRQLTNIDEESETEISQTLVDKQFNLIAAVQTLKDGKLNRSDHAKFSGRHPMASKAMMSDLQQLRGNAIKTKVTVDVSALRRSMCETFGEREESDWSVCGDGKTILPTSHNDNTSDAVTVGQEGCERDVDCQRGNIADGWKQQNKDKELACPLECNSIDTVDYSAVSKWRESGASLKQTTTETRDCSSAGECTTTAREAARELPTRQLSVSAAAGSAERESDSSCNMSPSLLDNFPKVKPYTVVDLSTMAELSSTEVEQCLHDAKMSEELDYNCNEKPTDDSGGLPPDDLALPPKKTTSQVRKSSASSTESAPTAPFTHEVDSLGDFRTRAFTAPANYSSFPNSSYDSGKVVCGVDTPSASSSTRGSLCKSISKPDRPPPDPPTCLAPSTTESTPISSMSGSCQSLPEVFTEQPEPQSDSPESKEVGAATEALQFHCEASDDDGASVPLERSQSKRNHVRSYSVSELQNRPLPLAYNGGMQLTNPRLSPNASTSVVLPWLSLASSTDGTYTPHFKALPDDDLPTTHFYDDIDDVRKKAKEHRLVCRQRSEPPVHGRYDSSVNDERLDEDTDSEHEFIESIQPPELPFRAPLDANGRCATTSDSTSSPETARASFPPVGSNDKIIQRSKLSRLLKKLSTKKKEDDGKKTKQKSQTPEPLRRNGSQRVSSDSSQAELLATPLQNRRKFPISFSLRGKSEARKSQLRQRSHTMDAIASSIISTKTSKPSSGFVSGTSKSAQQSTLSRKLKSATQLQAARRSSVSKAEMSTCRNSALPELPTRRSTSTGNLYPSKDEEPSYANFPFSRVSMLPPSKPLRSLVPDTSFSHTSEVDDKTKDSDVFDETNDVNDWSSQVQLSMARLSQRIPENGNSSSDNCTRIPAVKDALVDPDGRPSEKPNAASPATSIEPSGSPSNSPRSSSTNSWHSASFPIMGFNSSSSCPLDVFKVLVDAHKQTVQRISSSASVTCDCSRVESIPYSQFHPTGQQLPLDYEEYIVFPVRGSSVNGACGRTYTAWQQDCGTSDLRMLANSISEKLILQSTDPAVMHVCCLKRNPALSAAAAQSTGYLYLSSQLPQETLRQFIDNSEEFHSTDAEAYEREVCRVLLQVCCGIAYLQNQDIKSYPICSKSVVVMNGGSCTSRSNRSVQVALNCLPLLGNDQSNCLLEDEAAVLRRLGCLLYEMMHLSSYTIPEHSRYSEVPTIPMRSLYSHGLKNIALNTIKANASLLHVCGLLQTLLFGPGDLRHLPLDVAQMTTEKWVDRRCVEIVTDILKDISTVPTTTGVHAADARHVLNFYKIHLECKFLTEMAPAEILKASLMVWT